MTEIKKYRIFCLTEEIWVEGWGVNPPTTCYNNTTHSVNINSVQELEIIGDNIITIKEEKIPTQGNIQIDTHTFDIPSGTTGSETYYTNVYPYAINILTMTICPTLDNIGDYVYADIGHHTTIGILTEDISSGITGGITGFGVSQTVIDNINIGYDVTLTDGVNTNELGRCVMKDSVNNKISTEFATINIFSATSPTYVKQTAKVVNKLYFPLSFPIQIGSNKIGSSHIPANVVGRMIYVNNDGNAKKFTFYLEYLY